MKKAASVLFCIGLLTTLVVWIFQKLDVPSFGTKPDFIAENTVEPAKAPLRLNPSKQADLSRDPTAAIPFVSSAITTSVHTLGDLFRADLQRGLEHRVSSDDRSRLVKLKSRFFVAAPANANFGSDDEFYLTFAGTPNAQQKAAMAAQGIYLVEHITKTTWRGIVDKDSTVDAVDSLLGAEPVWPVDKWSPDLWNRYLTAGVPDESIEVVVAFTETTGWAEATTVLTAAGADALAPDFQYGQKLRVKAGYAGLLLLCGSAVVSSVELPPPPRTMDNQNAARLSHVDDVQTAPYGLTGTNINVMLRDGGGVAPHPDYEGRVTAAESLAVHYHSTHVAGTIAGNGSGYAEAKGMAPQAQLYSYDYNGSDADELIDAKNTYDARLSNHSYGYVVGWEDTAWNNNTNLFGAYTTDTRDWDAVVHDENLYIFKSAGNDRDDTGTGYPHDGTLYGDDYYDCMGTISSAKNIITVGAVDAAGAMSTFSAFGPTDDGRIKPDLVADGVLLISTYTNSNYAYMSGTSMSSPVACGTAALVLEQYRALHTNAWPSAAYLKGLLIHTAKDMGRSGPDYAYGWGLVDAQAAVDFILNSATTNGLCREENISEGQTNRFELIVSPNTSAFRVTTYWTDIEGSATAADALVNDLDVKLIAPDGITVYCPYVMPFVVDGSSPTNPAVTGINQQDNVEQVDVQAPVAGIWTVEVTGSLVPSGSQDYVVFINDFQFPHVECDTTSIALTADAGQSDNISVVVSNSGTSDLVFTITDNRAGNYTWTDSDREGGPVYNWIDITSVGSYGYLPDDGASDLFDIGFNLPFFGKQFSQYSIGGNGGIGFSLYGWSYLNTALPTSSATPESLFPFWDDLNTDHDNGGSGWIYFYSTPERLVITFEDVPRWDTDELQTFQTILYPDGRIIYQYKDMNGDLASCTVGLQENGLDGRFTQVAYDQAYVKNNLAVEFTPPPIWLSYLPTAASLPPGSSTSIWFTASASNLTAGSYTSIVSLASNDPDTPVLTIPVVFIVTEPDADSDGLPDSWEAQYYGGITNANPSALAANGINTVYESYVIGLDPTDAQSLFVPENARLNGNNLVFDWLSTPGRVYTIYWASDLFNGFSLMQSNYTGGVFTDTVHSANNDGFYRIEVQLAP